MKPQCAEVLKYMQRNIRGITQRDALGIGVYRLASRISDLRREGYRIRTQMEPVRKADGSKTNIARYVLEVDYGTNGEIENAKVDS